jgi:hypothetical protein
MVARTNVEHGPDTAEQDVNKSAETVT